MSAWLALIGRVNNAQLRLFGEDCLLPSGSSIGIFDPLGDPPQAITSEVGLTMRISQETSPTLRITEEEAANLGNRDIVTVRGANYIVTRIDAAVDGLVPVRLMPDSTDAASPSEGDRWQ